MKEKLKKIKLILSKVDVVFMKIFRKNIFLATFYYFFKKNFWREHKAVLNGRYQYYLNSKDLKGNSFLLRRSIHRIEKGILMRPRREVFAASYIEETVDNYITLTNSSNKFSNSLKWANDVLKNYFDIVDASKSKVIEKSKEKYHKNGLRNVDIESKLVPYKRNYDKRPNLNIDELKKLAIYRRSVRWFTNKEIEHTKIDEAIKIAAYSPSACNRLPYKFMIFDEKEKVESIAKTAMGTAGYLENIPVIAAVIGDLSAYPNERDRHLIYIDSSLAAMSFVYGLEVQGISSCIINWPDIEKREKNINNLLNLQSFERVTMLIALGYPDPEGMVAYSQKKELEEVRSYN